MKLHLDDSFNKHLPADPDKSNTLRQVLNACFSFVDPKVPSNPKLIHVSKELLDTLGIELGKSTEKIFFDVFSGTKVLENTQPYAMCYGGHQFGNWAGQLGDGRAINLFEIVHKDKRWSLQLKGSGKTPYSRNADGLAVLRSSIREHLCSEAMFHLGVPTTRSLSLMLTGDQVLRDMMYDGNSAYEKGAVICRVSPSFIRFGNFQILASRRDVKNLKILTDYTIQHFFPEIKEEGKVGYLEFFEQVTDLTIQMIIEWQRVGFVHGVMNTDNMSILGVTIDYGPYGWLDDYNPNWTPNTTDKNHRRYRFGNQGPIAHWNLFQLANALYPLINEKEDLERMIDSVEAKYREGFYFMMRSKLGLRTTMDSDTSLIAELENVLTLAEIDMTIFYRLLSEFVAQDSPKQNFEKIMYAFYNPDTLSEDVSIAWHQWMKNYAIRLNVEILSQSERKEYMNTINPKYVLRNYMTQLAIDAANEGDYSLIEELHELLKSPYAEQKENEKWFAKRPEWARHKVGCSMLSCSS